LSDRTAEFELQQRRGRIQRHTQQLKTVDFFNVLTGPELLESTEEHLPAHRERLYPPTVALSMFIKQGLSADRSCQQAVDSWAAQRAAEGLSVNSVGTGGYCQARQRLPTQMVSALARQSAHLLSSQAPHQWRWRDRCVKLVDGTGISMPDTPENQARYPQPSSQAAGVGFPMARVVAVICLSTGAVLDAAMGPLEGKGHSELDLFRGLPEAFSGGDVMLADALYCNYFLIATLMARGVDVLFEQNGARITDFRQGRKLGARDHRVCWSKPKKCPQWMTPQQFAAFPSQISVRELDVGGRILVTTLLDARKVGKKALLGLYTQRWHVELDLRSIKTTLGMDVLSCKTPSMVEKELGVYLLAYNIIRLLMAQAAQQAGILPRQISFKHTVQLWTQWTLQGCGTSPEQRNTLLRLIAQCRVGARPGRKEPRARKRRPKSYDWLKVPRAQARQQL